MRLLNFSSSLPEKQAVSPRAIRALERAHFLENEKWHVPILPLRF